MLFFLKKKKNLAIGDVDNQIFMILESSYT